MPYRDDQNNEYQSLDDLEEEEKKPKRSFNPFKNLYADGKGVSKEEELIAEHPTLKNFFVLVGRKLNQIFTVNLLLVMGLFPLFFALFVMGGYLSYHRLEPYYLLYAPLRGVLLFDHSASASALWTIFSRQSSFAILSTGDYVLLGLSALALFTFGPTRVGLTYILRDMVRGEPVMMWQDFWKTIRRNLRQAICFGVLDVAIVFLIVYDIMFFNLNYGVSMVIDTMFFMSLMLGLLYAFMRIYIYLMIVTFDLSLFKMFKNAIRFTVLGVKRNFMAFFGVVLVLMINYVVLAAFFPLGVILPFVIVPSLCMLMGVYAAFPVIKKYMIDPFYEKTDAVYNEEYEE